MFGKYGSGGLLEEGTHEKTKCLDGNLGEFCKGLELYFLPFTSARSKEWVVILNDEAARKKINHFLRKFILFFISLFVTLFHFLKSDVTVAFYFTNYI